MDRGLQFIEARHELHCCENFYQIALDYAECYRSVPALAPLVFPTQQEAPHQRSRRSRSRSRPIDHFVDREAARGQEDYDRAAAEKSSDPGSDALFHRATLGDNL
ncbi:hypothetical protein KIN20_011815 [Parelaphostrongylus tenuis]|uniref:Uncharacterized protein n=1 Tax=Parelaphostrongylus tenuis TaxID=148309 RepID=A0AAD5N0K7_PARTN|nr:hypothetical protein KIN20_011815 [Parelaphostrongylus tenuis]